MLVGRGFGRAGAHEPARTSRFGNAPAATRPAAPQLKGLHTFAAAMKFSALRTHFAAIRARQSQAVYAVMGIAAAAALAWALWEHYLKGL